VTHQTATQKSGADSSPSPCGTAASARCTCHAELRTHNVVCVRVTAVAEAAVRWDWEEKLTAYVGKSQLLQAGKKNGRRRPYMRWEGGEEVRGRLRPLAGITGDDVVGRLGDCGGSGCFEALREAAGAGGFGVRGGDSFDLGEGKVLMAAGNA
jgi:hypothetical protein